MLSGSSEWWERAAVRALQLGLVGILVLGVVTRNISVAINAALAFLVTLVPSLLRRDLRIHLDLSLVLFVTTAVFLHALGMIGLYDTVWWWDHLTHTLAAMVVAGAGYTLVVALDAHSDRIRIPEAHLPAYIIGITFLLGLLWESVELGARIVTARLGIEVIWVHYGPGDTFWDLVFDVLGAIVVVFFGRTRLEPTIESVREWLDRRLETGSAEESGPRE